MADDASVTVQATVLPDEIAKTFAGPDEAQDEAADDTERVPASGITPSGGDNQAQC